MPIKIGGFSNTNHVKTSKNNNNKGKNFGISEDILDKGSPFDTIAVDKAQKTEADSRDQPHGLIWRIAVWEKRLGQVKSKGQGL